MALKLSNNATSTLAGSIDDAVTSLSVQTADASLFPTLGAGDWFPVTVRDAAGNIEVMKCTARATAVLTVVRAQEGTAAIAFAAGSRIDLRMTVGAMAALETPEAIAGAAAKATPVGADTMGYRNSSGGGWVQSTLDQLKAFYLNGIGATIWTALGALIAGGTEKTALVNDDKIAIADSEDGDSTAFATLDSLRTLLGFGINVGHVSMCNGPVEPGHLRMGEGGTYVRADYPELAAWMDLYGTTAFGLTAPEIAAGTLPDWRDYSPRTAGGTLGPAVGAKQEDAGQRITGFSGNYLRSGGGNTGALSTSSVGPTNTGATNGANFGYDSPLYFDSGDSPGARVSNDETRVKSFGVRWQIKAYGAFINAGTADLVAMEATVAVAVRYDGQVISDSQAAAARKTLGMEFGYPMLHLRDEKTSGTAGGSISTGANTRVLNTVVVNEISGASLSSNQFTLPAGTYEVDCRCPAFAVLEVQPYLYNITDAVVALLGENGYLQNTISMAVHYAVRGRITLTSPKVFELRMYAGGNSGGGAGNAVSSGRPEVYSSVLIRKLK